jgi:hypothetical protein
MTHYRQCSGGSRHLFSHKLKWQRRSVQSDVLSVEEIQAVLSDLQTNESWYYPLFLLWLSTPRFQESCHPCDQYTRGLEDMTNASLQRGR